MMGFNSKFEVAIVKAMVERTRRMAVESFSIGISRPVIFDLQYKDFLNTFCAGCRSRLGHTLTFVCYPDVKSLKIL